MLFQEVIGQGELKNHLVELVENNRLSHALLFVGKEGSGALPLALALADYITCIQQVRPETGPDLFGVASNPQKSAETESKISWQRADASTQKHPAYSKVKNLVHPDVHFSYPVITKKAGTPPISTDYIQEWREFFTSYPYGNVYDWLQFIGAENKQGNITAHECNDIIRKLSLKSFESEYKILVLWLPEYLGNEGNKLLKLIEEPPPNTLFILVTENESLILPTILSRTQIIRVPPIETADITAALVSRAKAPENQAHKISAVAEGNYHEALQMIQHGGEDWESFFRDWLNCVLKTGPIAQSKWVEEISKLGRERQKQFLRYCNHLLEQAIKLRVMAESHNPEGTSLSIRDNERDFAGRLNSLADISQQNAIVEELDRAALYVERNANPKMLFHALTIRLYHILAHRRVIDIT